MIKRNATGKLFFLLLLALLYPAQYAHAQNNTVNVSVTIDATEFPQWTKDIRRWEIVAFGAFPFAMFFATFGMDMYRYAGTGWQDTRYAPWPIKSAGAVEMTPREYETTMIIAAGMSVAIAFADLIIVQVKRHKARQYAESLPVGTTIITKRPWPPVPEPEELPETTDADTETASGETASGESAAPADTENPEQGLFGKPQNP